MLHSVQSRMAESALRRRAVPLNLPYTKHRRTIRLFPATLDKEIVQRSAATETWKVFETKQVMDV